jgi:PAS domain S-box-containing protein
MSWLMPAVITTFAVSVVLALVFLYLFLQERQRHLVIWTCAWVVYSLRFVFQILIVRYGYSEWLWFANQATTIASGILLLWGTFVFSGKRMPPAWLYGSLLCCAWTVAALWYELAFFWLTMPLFALNGGIYIWTGVMLLGYREALGVGHKITGWAFVVWGLHKLDYPFIRPVEWFAPWGYLLGSLLQLIVALGLILLYFELTKKRLIFNEQRYRRVLEDQAEYIVRWLPDGTRTYVNDAYCRLTGSSREQIEGTSFFPRLPENLRVQLTSRIVGLTPGHPAITWERQIKVADGGRRWVRWTDRGFFNEDQELVELQSSGQDIDDQRRAETALRESEQRYRDLFENNYLPMLLIDPADGAIGEANPAACSFYGYDEKRMTGMRLQQINTRPDDEICRMLDDSVRSVKNFHQARHRLASGSVRDVEVVCLPVNVSGRKMLNSIIYDITDRKHAESQLALLFTAIEQAAESLIITDANANIQFVNPAFEKRSGYKREEVLGLNPRILKSGVQDGDFYRRMWNRLSAGEQWHGRLVNRTKEGNRFEEDVAISPVRGDDGEIVSYVKIARDVTLEVELESQLIQSQKMEAVGRLAGGVAHDFNNLLSVIMGYAELCRLQLGDDQPLRSKVQEIINAADSASLLTRQLLAFSRKQVLQFEILNMSKIVRAMKNMLGRLIGEHIRLEISLVDDLDTIRADRSQVEQIIMNLVVNSRDAIRGDGFICIETANVGAPPDCDLASADENRHWVMLKISDNGAGIPTGLTSKVFDPFFTTKEIGKGTGLGLSTVHGIVKQHGGTIRLESSPGEGTVFRICFPAEIEKAAPVVVQPTKKRSGHGGATILVVEDEDIVRSVVGDILKSQGYNVIEVAESSKAERVALDHEGKIDLLISDVVMPKMNGMEVAACISARRPEMKVLLMSGYADGNVDGGEAAAVEGNFIQKPFTVSSLSQKVMEVLGS